MRFEQARRTARETVDELQKAAKAHVQLAKDQYNDYTTRHGDPVDRATQVVREPLERSRERVLELSRDVNERTEELAQVVTSRTQEVTKRVTKETETVAERLRGRLPTRRDVMSREVKTVEHEPDTEQASKQPQGGSKAKTGAGEKD